MKKTDRSDKSVRSVAALTPERAILSSISTQLPGYENGNKRGPEKDREGEWRKEMVDTTRIYRGNAIVVEKSTHTMGGKLITAARYVCHLTSITVRDETLDGIKRKIDEALDSTN
jgi:hypothetical protein